MVLGLRLVLVGARCQRPASLLRPPLRLLPVEPVEHGAVQRMRAVMLDEPLSSALRAQLGQRPFGGREVRGALDPVARRGYLLGVPHGEDARAEPQQEVREEVPHCPWLRHVGGGGFEGAQHCLLFRAPVDEM